MEYDDKLYCPNAEVEYNCTVSGSLTWRILQDDGMQLDGDVTYTMAPSNQASVTIGKFSFERLSPSPLVSNVSFTAQPNINGYTIICEDALLANENVTIRVAGKLTKEVMEKFIFKLD